MNSAIGLLETVNGLRIMFFSCSYPLTTSFSNSQSSLQIYSATLPLYIGRILFFLSSCSLSFGNFACCSQAALPQFIAFSIHSLPLLLTLTICLAPYTFPHSLPPSLSLSLPISSSILSPPRSVSPAG